MYQDWKAIHYLINGTVRIFKLALMLPQWQTVKWYVGFDTAHFNMQHATLKQVLGALKEMEKKYDRYLESGGARR